ncbi:hypothetical protein ABB37_04776 [Leptomonas pyrrhocoris]|uniref:C2H2-type domain-containing protein n=1 Tax=Leptomonas pyrrhocoris TaxID=157538 RepID=A0A0M9G222_LEPPY|nr:hypothetical protein ABB37_04776 [Leptomonas pyrrhocoris]KPA80576.1 hypothetical protein ABB37_04776 [Leptomonas pyrrhocoris]|eukprot:XP_015659015.1 hypothetical protein ABB37_04776 [Leptomonas pyrrhocoris]
MDMDTQRKEEWCITLQSFLSSRLRTPSYSVASRQQPFISVPPMIPRTQFLLDGVVWAVNDCPNWVLDAWLTVQNCIKDTGKRLAELSEELRRTVASSSTSPGGPSSSAAGTAAAGGAASSRTVMVAPRGSALDRERTYRAHAAVQDVYIAFCVLDALVKNVCAEAASKLHAAVDVELPHLVADCVPIFLPATSYWIENAVEEYRHLFHALLDSWLVLKAFNSDVHRRLQEYVQDRLQRTREVEEKAEQEGSEFADGAADNGGVDGTNSITGAAAQRSGAGNNSSTANVWQQSVQHIIESTARVSAAVVAAGPASTTTKADTAGKSAALSKFERGVRTPETVERTLKSFLNYVFPPRRTPAARHRCPHCGALFRDDKSKNAHYRCHFYARNYLKQDEKLVRLTYPSAADFAEHTADLKREGFFTRTVEVLEEAYKGGERGAVKIRKLEEAPTEPTEGAP